MALSDLTLMQFCNLPDNEQRTLITDHLNSIWIADFVIKSRSLVGINIMLQNRISPLWLKQRLQVMVSRRMYEANIQLALVEHFIVTGKVVDPKQLTAIRLIQIGVTWDVINQRELVSVYRFYIIHVHLTKDPVDFPIETHKYFWQAVRSIGTDLPSNERTELLRRLLDVQRLVDVAFYTKLNHRKIYEWAKEAVPREMWQVFALHGNLIGEQYIKWAIDDGTLTEIPIDMTGSAKQLISGIPFVAQHLIVLAISEWSDEYETFTLEFCSEAAIYNLRLDQLLTCEQQLPDDIESQVNFIHHLITTTPRNVTKNDLETLIDLYPGMHFTLERLPWLNTFRRYGVQLDAYYFIRDNSMVSVDEYWGYFNSIPVRTRAQLIAARSALFAYCHRYKITCPANKVPRVIGVWIRAPVCKLGEEEVLGAFEDTDPETFVEMLNYVFLREHVDLNVEKMMLSPYKLLLMAEFYKTNANMLRRLRQVSDYCLYGSVHLDYFVDFEHLLKKSLANKQLNSIARNAQRWFGNDFW